MDFEKAIFNFDESFKFDWFGVLFVLWFDKSDSFIKSFPFEFDIWEFKLLCNIKLSYNC